MIKQISEKTTLEKTTMAFTPWVLVGSPENYGISKAMGFTQLGVKFTQRKKALAIAPGDRVIYYLTGLMCIAGIVTVASPMRETYSQPIWPCSNPRAPQGEAYPFRYDIEPHWIPTNEADFLPVKSIKDRLLYLEKWPAKNWTLGFQGNLHQWPMADYEWVEACCLSGQALGQI